MVKHSSVTGVLELSGALTTDLDRVRLTLLLICDSFDSWLWNGFLELALGIKPNNMIAVFFFFFSKILFNYAIQEKFFTWLVNSSLNCTRKPISHSPLRDSCDIGFRVEFNGEFPRQVMNFSLVHLHSPRQALLHPQLISSLHAFDASASIVHLEDQPSGDCCQPHSAGVD